MMIMHDKLEELLQTKLMSFNEKYIEARNNFLNRQMEIIKKNDPSFQGTVQDFFNSHTVASKSTYYEKKFYDVVAHRYVNYDVVEDNIGILYDEIGRKVHEQSKRTKEFLVYDYYSKVIISLISMLDKVQNLQNKNVDTLVDDASTPVVSEEVPPQGPKF